MIEVYWDELPKHRTPILNYCRVLIEEGKDSEESLKIKYRPEDVLPGFDGIRVFVPNIGKASNLTVEENSLGRSVFKPLRASRKAV